MLLASVLKEQTKTRGKARLTSMLRSGKELKVFSLPQKDLKEFTTVDGASFHLDEEIIRRVNEQFEVPARTEKVLIIKR